MRDVLAQAADLDGEDEGAQDGDSEEEDEANTAEEENGTYKPPPLFEPAHSALSDLRAIFKLP